MYLNSPYQICPVRIKGMCFPGIIRGRRVGAGGWAFRESRNPIGQAEPRRQTVSCAAALDFLPRRTPVSAGSHRKRKMEGPSALGGMRLSTRSPASPPHASGFDRTVPGPPPCARLRVFSGAGGVRAQIQQGLGPCPPALLSSSPFPSFPRTRESRFCADLARKRAPRVRGGDDSNAVAAEPQPITS